MGSVDLIALCLDAIREISNEIRGAILYLDAGCAEAFQFIGAFPVLLEIGVRTVCSLERMSPLDATASSNSTVMDPANKLVIITSRLLSDAHCHILRCLGAHKMVQHCTIFTSISKISHSAHVDSPLGPDAFHEYESLLIQDYNEKYFEKDKRNNYVGNEDMEQAYPKSLTVSVHHFPMILCPVTSRVFVTPSEGTVAESCFCLSADDEDEKSHDEDENSLSPGLPSISTGAPFDPDDIPPGVYSTAHFLYHLADKMDLKVEVFSFGDTSKAIGKIMMDMSTLYDVGRRSRQSAGLLLVDRTLDLLTPCCHGDSFLDRVIWSLPHKERTVPSSTRSKDSKRSFTVRRSPLAIEVPFDNVLKEHERHCQLFQGICSFMSAWESVDLVSESLGVGSLKMKNITDSDKPIFSGSFFSNYAGKSYLEALLERGAKDGIMLIKKWLSEAVGREKLNSASKSPHKTASTEENLAMVKMLLQSQRALIRNSGVIKLALAAEVARCEPQSTRWDAFVNAERILSVTAAESSQSLSSEIRDFIDTTTLLRPNQHSKATESSHGVLSLHDALLLSIVGYILAGESFPAYASNGPFSWKEEHPLKKAVIDCILKNPSSAHFQFLDGLETKLESRANSTRDTDVKEVTSENDDFDDKWESWDSDEADNENDLYSDAEVRLQLEEKIDQLFKFFHKLSFLKRSSPTLHEGLTALSKFETDSYNRKCLLYKLLCAILSKYEVPGLEYHPSQFGRILKGGFGRFLSQVKPSLGDQNIILIYVVGGINMLEAREIMEALADCNRPDLELILGGTTLLSPDDMFELMLGSQSLHAH